MSVTQICELHLERPTGPKTPLRASRLSRGNTIARERPLGRHVILRVGHRKAEVKSWKKKNNNTQM